VPNIYEEVKGKLQGLIDNAAAIACTADIWTSRTQDPYITVTAHFLDGSQLRTAVLGSKHLPGSHTGQHIAAAIADILQEWRCEEKVVCFVTDNGANMLAAMQILRYPHIPCVAHTVNLLVKDAWKKIASISAVLSKLKDIVTFFK